MNRQRTSLLLCLLFALGFVQTAHSQGIPSEGKDFYLGFIYPPYNDVVYSQTAGYFRVYAYVSSFQNNTVSVSYFDPLTKKEGYPNNYPVAARQTTQIPLDRTQMLMREGDKPGEFKSCHITAKKPINVQFFSTGANSGGSYLALPVNAWGKEYVVAAYKDNGPGNGAMLGGRGPSGLDQAGGVFMIIAAYDGTNVTIIPTARTTGNHFGVNQGQGATGKPQPYNVGLNRGQCWLVKSYSATTDDGEDDISASIVKSDKPVAVISGHEDAWIDGSDVAGFSLEARDYMVEQMIPTEYWDNTGHITIPFIDSSPNNGEGIGDLARIYVSDKNVPTVVHAERNGTIFDKNPGPYLWPEDLNYSEFPVHFSADSGKNFMVVQYDIRNHSTQRTTPPFPSPSMMSIVPRAMWRNAYMWYVPSNINERLQSYYVHVIAPKDGVNLYYEPLDSVYKRNWFSDSLRVSVNGSNAFTNINGLGAQKRKWMNIPGHPDLAGYTFGVSPGTSYYIKAPFPFMVYHFGCRAVDFDGDLGDFDNDDNFFSYALPLGMALSKPVPKRLRITVDTLCSGWRVCVTDSNNPGGIKSVTLLDDPNGEIIIGGRYKWVNAGFDPSDDPLNLKEIVYEPADRDICFNVRVENPGQDAYAPLYIVDVNGNGKIIELRYKKASVEFMPVNAVPNPAFDSVGLFLQPYNPVSKQYEPSYIGEEICREYLFINKLGSPRSFKLLKADVDQPSPFRVTNVDPPIGSSIGPDDTVRITACFIGPDTLMYLDSINFETDCFPTRLPLVGHPGTPIIEADDKHFGTILINSRKCSDVEVRNIGNKPFTLDRQWVMDNLGNQFLFDTLHPKNINLPITLGPGQKHKFWFCYEPSDEGYDSTQMNWHSDIKEPYTNQIKPFSVLTGSGIKPGVNWDRPVESYDRICDDDTVQRVNLINTGTAEAQLTRIWIDGPHANEFEVVNTENNTNPPTWGGTVLPVGDTMWVDVKYTPNLALLPDPYAPRLAYLKTSATLDSTAIPTLELRAIVRRGIPVLGTNTTSDTLDFGYVNVGNQVMRPVRITNTGDAPLIITSYETPGRPFLRLEPDLTPNLPFVIDTGVTVAWEVWGTMDTWGDTTVPLKFNFATPCVKPVIPQLLFKSRNNVVLLEIPPHPPTYIDCRTSEVSGTLSNLGNLVQINLRRVRIVNGLTPNDDANLFTFVETGTNEIIYPGAGKLMDAGDVANFPIRFSPSFTGTVGAYLWAEWDSAGVKFWQDSVEITAEGVALSNFFSVENTANVGQPYTAVTNDFFVIPVRITQDLTAPKDAQPVGAKGATFTITWKGDLFDFIRDQMDEMPNLDARIVSGPTRDANGNESVTIHVEAETGEINTAGDLVHLRFQLMISRELLSDFIISDGFFTDAGGNPICYILNQHIPAQFVPVDRCGDQTVRDFLNDLKPTTISYLNPNPAVPGADMKLGYRVNVSIAPVTIELFDVLGDKVRTLQANHASAKGDHVATIVTDGLAAGTYTVRLSGADWVETTSFIIEK